MTAYLVGASVMTGEPTIAIPQTAWSSKLGDAMARAERRDRGSALALYVVHRLLDSFPLGDAERDACAVVHGTQLGCGATNDAYHRKLVTAGPSRSLAGLFGYTVPSAPIGEVAIAFGFRAHQSVVMAGRCSGIAAIAEARRVLACGRATRVLVLAGDVLGPDRVTWLDAMDAGAPAEAIVALLFEHESVAKSPRAVLERATLQRSALPTAGVRGTNFLGATGIVELARWLESDARTFEMSAIDGTGITGNMTFERR